MFGIVRHFVAHMVTTVSAAAFVFCLLVTVRAIVGGVAGRRVALSSILRFLLFSALLCFIVYVPTALHIVQSLAQDLDALIDQAPVRLELRFTRTAHTDAAAEFLEVGPHASQSRQHVFELRQLDLDFGFARAGARRKDVENQLCAIHHACADGILDVLALAR